jgi:hypothetical protein
MFDMGRQSSYAYASLVARQVTTNIITLFDVIVYWQIKMMMWIIDHA